MIMTNETQEPLERLITETRNLELRTDDLEFALRQYYTYDVDVLDQEAHRKLTLARKMLRDINRSLTDCAEYMEEAKKLEEELEDLYGITR